MPVLIRIAFRNLLEHKAKSLIIGVLLALGVVILVVGNAFMDTAAQGVKDTFIGNYTGDIFVAAKAKTPVSLFGVASVGGRETTQNLPYFDKVAAKLRSEPGVTGVTSQVTGFAMASLKDAPESAAADASAAGLRPPLRHRPDELLQALHQRHADPRQAPPARRGRHRRLQGDDRPLQEGPRRRAQGRRRAPPHRHRASRASRSGRCPSSA